MSSRALVTALILVALFKGPASAAEKEGSAETLPELARARLEAARAVLKDVQEHYANGTADEEKVYRWSRRLLKLERTQSDKKAPQRAALEAHLKRMKKLETLTRDRFKAGRLPRYQLFSATYYRREAELWLARAKTEK